MSTVSDLPEFIDVDGERIALRQVEGKSPGIVWLGGFKSDMLGTKAETLSEWAKANGHSFIRHDYSGHGESGGRFVDGTISLWLKQSLEVVRQRTSGPQILVGSSMGAWIALRMAQELHKAGEGERLGALLLLAPAPDFTAELMEPLLTEEQKRDLEEKGYFEEPSEYSPEPNVYTKALFDDGRENRVMTGLIDTHCPVHILQGMADPDVPHEHALRLVEHLPADDVTVSLIRDGDHRLSRPQDLSMMVSAVEALIARISQ
ncbi:alpha/beta hydrolase [Aquamicrobium zhengzhouense]|uniref:Palmitoyl-protein thioesterase ABHD10, mitochondrial n=1 Tax=Aquamicrobium zhengzhouense TaxID=2781738 RepID=A0ABS0SHT5_9HYPH|nr:alpha/beta hydrolase [Aquamicrobium zhengzhouense]MBI1622864.1 alpha/beta hydrolase [Aquamicrobium zhengzhouense]